MTGCLSKIPPYPQEMETWWWTKAVEKWPEASESRILNLLRDEIVVQSDRFNKARDFSPASYGSRDLSILAYGNFFFPRTWLQNTFVLAETMDLRGWKAPLKGPVRILDLGAGSGPAGLATLRLLRERGITNPIELRAVDYSGKSLAHLTRIHAENGHLWPRTSVTTDRIDLSKALPNKSSQSYDLVLLSSSLNEIAEGRDSSQIAKDLVGISEFLKPSGFLIVVEPALKDTCDRLHLASSAIEVGSLHLHGPYFNGATCPFVLSGARYHSHEVRRRKPPEIVQRLNQPIGLSVKDHKFGFILLSPKKPISFDPGPSIIRLVSPVMKKKGVYSFIGIGGDAQERCYEIQIRDLRASHREFIGGMERGDVLLLRAWEAYEEGRRIRIPRADAIEILWKPE